MACNGNCNQGRQCDCGSLTSGERSKTNDAWEVVDDWCVAVGVVVLFFIIVEFLAKN